MRNILLTSSLGISAGLNFGWGLVNILDYANARAIVLQEQFSRAPELTQEIYKGAEKIVEGIASGDLYTAMFNFGTAGVSGSLAVYCAYRKREDFCQDKKLKNN